MRTVGAPWTWVTLRIAAIGVAAVLALGCQSADEHPRAFSFAIAESVRELLDPGLPATPLVDGWIVSGAGVVLDRDTIDEGMPDGEVLVVATVRGPPDHRGWLPIVPVAAARIAADGSFQLEADPHHELLRAAEQLVVQLDTLTHSAHAVLHRSEEGSFGGPLQLNVFEASE